MIIDAVLPWVDGSDPVLSAKRATYALGGELSNDETGGVSRYANTGELVRCVASIFRFAPFIRKVFIVTDGQDPCLGDMLQKYFPDRKDDVVTVDHKVIFRGREYALPVFNSNSIDTLIWNIPELSEHFIYLNDDMMMVRPIVPEDFFCDGKVVCYAKRLPSVFVKFLRFLKPSHVGYKVSMLRAQELMGGGGHIINLGHGPCPMLKSWFEKWAVEHPEMVELNLRYKFRDVDQFEAQEPFYLDMEKQGRLRLIPDTETGLLFMKHGGSDYVRRKIDSFKADKKRKFACFNALNLCTPEEIKIVYSWLDSRIFG